MARKQMPWVIILLACWLTGMIVSLLGAVNYMFAACMTGLIFTAMIIVFIYQKVGHKSGVRHKH